MDREYEDTLGWLMRLAPDLMDEARLRANVLERISVLQPVGRRALSQRLRIPEREIRTITDRLRDDGFLAVGASGMCLSEKGVGVLGHVRQLTHALSGLYALEQTLARSLGVGSVHIVPGNADEDPEALREAGRMAARLLTALLSDGMTLTVSGGNSVAAVAAAMPRSARRTDVHVLPGRGGIGAAFETQAGTLAAEIAHALGGRHSLLHIPDSVSPDTLRSLMDIPEVRDTLDALRRTDVLLYGIGRAEALSQSRTLPKDEIDAILSRGAVGEAVGNYFDAEGRLVFQSSEVGLSGEELRHVPHVIAVAAGALKARAIVAVMRHHQHELLVIDEGAAREIARILN